MPKQRYPYPFVGEKSEIEEKIWKKILPVRKKASAQDTWVGCIDGLDVDGVRDGSSVDNSYRARHPRRMRGMLRGCPVRIGSNRSSPCADRVTAGPPRKSPLYRAVVHRESKNTAQKAEQEKLEKLARKGPKPDETPAANSGGSGPVADAKPSGGTSSSPNVSTDKHRNYAVVAGIATMAAAAGWYLSSKKKPEEVQD